jgi:hypothetical protein
MHLDPDFSTLTYGDIGNRALQVRRMGKGDFLAFYAGLRATNPQAAELVYALIGFYIIEEIVQAKAVPESRWKENAHTRRVPVESDIVVRAKPGVSGRFERCLPIGEHRDRAYRVQPDILAAWGNLTVNDGYLQRSGRLPSFRNPDKFCQWLEKEHVTMIARNNV